MGLTPDIFHKQEYRLLMEAVIELEQEGNMVHPGTIFVKTRKWKDAPSAYQLAQMIEDVLPCVPSDIPVELQRFYESEALKYHKKFLMQAILVEGMSELAYDPEEALLKIDERLHRLQKLQHIKEDELDISTHLDNFKESLEKDELFVPSGIYDLDALIGGGFEAGTLNIVAARPSVGKTAFAMSCMKHTWNNQKHLFLSLEMSNQQILQRFITMLTNIPYYRVKEAIKQRSEITENAIELISSADMKISDASDIKIPEIVNIIETYEPNILWVDYLQLMRNAWPGRNFHSREEEVANYSAFFKGISKKYHIPVVLLAQFNREAAYGKRPQLHHLRESGALEQDVDVAIIIAHSKNEDFREIYVDKNRNGPVDNFSVNFYSSRMLFGRESVNGAP